MPAPTTTPLFFAPLITPIADAKSGIATPHWNAFFTGITNRLIAAEEAIAGIPGATLPDNLALLDLEQTWTALQHFPAGITISGYPITVTGPVTLPQTIPPLPANIAFTNVANPWSAPQTFPNNLTVGLGTGAIGYPWPGLVGNNSGPTALSLRNSTNNVEAFFLTHEAGAYFGTFTNHPLVIRTNNVQRMVIKADGRVGINTDAPTKELHVGDATETPIISYPGIIAQFASNAAQITALSLGAQAGVIAHPNGGFFGTWTNHPVIFRVNNTDVASLSNAVSSILRVSGGGVFTASGVSADPGDGLGPALRMGYNAAGDYGFVQAINTGVGLKTLKLSQSGGLTEVGGTLVVAGYINTYYPFFYVGGWRVDVTANCTIPGTGGGASLPPYMAFLNVDQTWLAKQRFDYGITVQGVDWNTWLDQPVRIDSNPTHNSLTATTSVNTPLYYAGGTPGMTGDVQNYETGTERRYKLIFHFKGGIVTSVTNNGPT